MKILINTITQQEVMAIQADQVSKGAKPEEMFFGIPDIGGEKLIPGEWLHKDDKWFDENADELVKHPYIKEAHIVLQDKMKEAIQEHGLQSFAEGIRAASDQYKQDLPEIADTVLKIVPYEAKGIE